jgi:hypothetical protein
MLMPPCLCQPHCSCRCLRQGYDNAGATKTNRGVCHHAVHPAADAAAQWHNPHPSPLSSAPPQLCSQVPTEHECSCRRTPPTPWALRGKQMPMREPKADQAVALSCCIVPSQLLIFSGLSANIYSCAMQMLLLSLGKFLCWIPSCLGSPCRHKNHSLKKPKI